MGDKKWQKIVGLLIKEADQVFLGHQHKRKQTKQGAKNERIVQQILLFRQSRCV